MDRITPTRRPEGRRQGTQRWHRLLFSHWEVPESVLRPLVPSALSLDAYEGRCYVGLVAFTMAEVRPYDWAPPIPTVTRFHEINLRTYVHLSGKEPGVFFFSLDAESTLAVQAARTLWDLPYFRSDFEHSDDGKDVHWRSRRQWPTPQAKPFEASFRIEEEIEPPKPDSLEFFLAERYQFYAADGAKLRRARVHHAPYRLHRANVTKLSTSLLDAAGLPTTGERLPDYFSPGVDVDVFALRPVEETSAPLKRSA